MNFVKTEEGVIEEIITNYHTANPPDTNIVLPYFDATVLTFFSQGQKKGGVNDGPHSLCHIVNSVFKPLKNSLMIPEHSAVVEGNGWQQDYENLYKYLCKQHRYVLLGGDHSVGNPSVLSSLSKVADPNNLFVIWIDAHPDCNTMAASISKNIHGQPLAGVLGFEPPWFEINSTLPTTNLLYFGIRDIDTFEAEQIAQHNIFHTSKLIEILTKINEIINSNPNAKFHVSFDVDALDPQYMGCTGCLVENGISPSEVSDIVSFVYDKLIAFDIVEFNPHIGTKEDQEISLNTIKEIVDGIAAKSFSKTV